MWIAILIIGIIAIIVYNSHAHEKDIQKFNRKQGTPELTSEAKMLMNDFYKDFTKGQRYAYYNLLSSLAECHASSSPSIKRKVAFTVRQTAQCLNISEDQADVYMHKNGVEELCRQIASIPKGEQLDSLISTAFGIASSAEGYVRGMKANEMALTIMMKTFEEAGISEEYVSNSLEKTALIAQKFM